MLRWLAFPFFNASERRLRAGWRVLIQLVVFLAVSAAPQRAIVEAKEAADANREAIFSQGALFMVLLFAVLFSVWVGTRFLDRRSFDGIGFRVERGFYVDLAFGAALGGALMAGIAGVESATGLASYGEAPELSGPVPRLAYLPIAVFVFVAVAVYEEAISRGYHLTNLAEGLSGGFLSRANATLLAMVLSSLAFGLGHAFNPDASAISSGNIVLAGAMLAVGYLTTGSLAIPIGLHLGWNFFQNLFDMPVSGQTFWAFGAVVSREVHGAEWLTGGPFGPEAGVTGLGAMLAGTLATFAWVRWRHGPLRMHPSFGRWPSPP